jgi:hypothetical protein
MRNLRTLQIGMLLLAAVIAIGLLTCLAIASEAWRCPYCGQSFPWPPNDPGGLADFQRRHMAVCPSRPSSGGQNTAPAGPSIGSQPPPAPSDNAAARQQALEEQRQREQAEANRRQEEFEKAKQEALASMKAITENELGLKGVISGDDLGLKGVGEAGAVNLGLKGVGETSPDRPQLKGVGESAPPSPTEPSPAPQGQPAKAGVKSSRVFQLSDADLAAEIARARGAMERMKSGFQADVKDLETWTHESQDAQAEAIRESLNLLTGAMTDVLAQGTYKALPRGSKGKRLQLAAAKATLDLAKSGLGYTESAHQRQKRLEAAQAVLEAGYGFLSDAKTKLKISEHGPTFTALASFGVNYSYEAIRWGISKQQVDMIIDGLGRRDTNGKLKAQQALAQYYKSLVDEQKRRREAAQ